MQECDISMSFLPKRDILSQLFPVKTKGLVKRTIQSPFPVQLHGVYPSAMRTGLTSPALIRPQPFSYSDAHEICSSHLVDRINSKQYEQSVPGSLLFKALLY